MIQHIQAYSSHLGGNLGEPRNKPNGTTALPASASLAGPSHCTWTGIGITGAW